MYHYVKGKGWVYGNPVPNFVLAHDSIYALVRAIDVPFNCPRTLALYVYNSPETELSHRISKGIKFSYAGPREASASKALVCVVRLEDLCTTT